MSPNLILHFKTFQKLVKSKKKNVIENEYVQRLYSQLDIWAHCLRL